MITQQTLQDIPQAKNSRTEYAHVTEAQQYYMALLQSLPLKGFGTPQPITTLGITSCYRGEGVTTVSTQLSQVAASSGMRVLLVDLNWKRPAVHRVFGVPRGPGIGEALAEEGSTEPPVQASHIPNLSLLTVGKMEKDFFVPNPFEKMAALIQSLQMDYDLIVFDLQESAQAGSTLSWSSLLEGVVIVIEAERVRWEVALRAKDLLVRSGANVLGTVMNKRRVHIPNWLYRTL